MEPESSEINEIPTEIIESVEPEPDGNSVTVPGIDSKAVSAVDGGELDVTRLKLWQRRYIAALQAGAGALESRLIANVSDYSIQKSLDADPVFARAWGLVTGGVAVLGRDAAREMAQATAPRLIDHFSSQATTAPNVRDQVAAGRLVLDSAGLTNQPSTVAVPIQVNVFGEGGFSKMLKEKEGTG